MYCLFRTSRLPVVYVFGRKPINIERCVDCLLEAAGLKASDRQETGPDMVLLRHDVVYAHQAGESS